MQFLDCFPRKSFTEGSKSYSDTEKKLPVIFYPPENISLFTYVINAFQIENKYLFIFSVRFLNLFEKDLPAEVFLN
jgi:hypothetical protein